MQEIQVRSLVGKLPWSREGNQLQCSGLENPRDGGAWATVPVAAAKSMQSCLTLCDPTEGSPPDSSVPGILQARILEWAAVSFPMHACMLSQFSRVRLCATLWTTAHEGPPSTGFSRQEYWSGLPFPSPATVHGVTLVGHD